MYATIVIGLEIDFAFSYRKRSAFKFHTVLQKLVSALLLTDALLEAHFGAI
jgi:hypothetical protein